MNVHSAVHIQPIKTPQQQVSGSHILLSDMQVFSELHQFRKLSDVPAPILGLTANLTLPTVGVVSLGILPLNVGNIP